MLKSLISLAAFAGVSIAGSVVRYDWDIDWVTAAPDGFSRPVIGINGKWPLPTLEATVGDVVVVNVNNKLANESTSIHFHGIHQVGTTNMDGPTGVTQCPIPPGYSYTYSFVVDQPGTYWYHSHTGSQYPDGLRGPIVVKDTKDPYAGQYAEEFLITLSDWYHQQSPDLLAVFETNNTNGIPPIPVGGLVNEATNAVANTTLKFQAGKTYKVRVINMSALMACFFFVDSHTITVIEVDGVTTQKASAEQIYIAPAQRYSILLTPKPGTDFTKNYGFQFAFDPNPFFGIPQLTPFGFPFNVTTWIEYNSAAPLPAAPVEYAWQPFDDSTTKPYSNQALLANPDKIATIDFTIGATSGGVPQALINGNSYIPQKVPTLYTALSAGDDATNPEVYGDVNPYVVDKGDIVEIIINNNHFAHHPFHLHGHFFQVVQRNAPETGNFNGDTSGFPSVPAQRDSLIIWPNSSAVLRFEADNPGVWLFHCHIEWHVAIGLTATFVEAPLDLQKSLTIPQAQKDICEAQCIPTSGNAAGNTQNYTDVTGANTVFTPDDGALYSQNPTCSVTPVSTSTWASPTTTGKSGSKGYTTSTVWTTHVYTVTECASTVTDCPARKTPYVTTETVALYTTVCPIEEESATETGTWKSGASETEWATGTAKTTVKAAGATETGTWAAAGTTWVPTTTAKSVVTAAAHRAAGAFEMVAAAAGVVAVALL